MKRRNCFALLAILIATTLQAQPMTDVDDGPAVWGQWTEWGDQQNGLYRNPVVPADFSDIDCISVGDDYYAISSTMQFSPGMTILHSRDLVNWEYAGHAVSYLTQISSALSWQEMNRYGRGVWAGTLRYHKGRFYLYFGTPDEGYFMTSAPKAEGPWEPLTCLLADDGWDDCTVCWDERGNGWFFGTCFKDNYKTFRFKMARDGRSIDHQSGVVVNEGNGREANKIIYHDGFYYLLFSEHKGGIGRYVMAKRDSKITGKFSEECQLLQPCTEANEPNQGGIVEGPDGHWYFLTHHGSGDWSGRIMSLLPVSWKNGWPMIGKLNDSSEPGVMVWKGTMPATQNARLNLQRSDDFDTPTLGAQWQWNYEPRREMFSLSERPGWLRLKAFKPLESQNLLKVGNTITQRSFRTQNNEVIVKLDITHIADGLHTGLAHFSHAYGAIGIFRHHGQNYIETIQGGKWEACQPIQSSSVWLKSVWGLDGMSRFYYSTDGDTFLPLGTYQLSWGFYRGDRIAVYCFNEQADTGYVDVDYLHYSF